MGILPKKMILAALTSLLAISAQAQDDGIAPLSANDVRIVFEKSVEQLKQKIEQSKNLTEEERVSISREIEEDADRIRTQLGDVVNQAVQLGETTYIGGVIVTYAGAFNFPSTLFPKLGLAPGAEVGLAVFLRGNSYLSDAFTAARAVIGGGEASLKAGQARALDRGLRLKLLLSTDRSSKPVVTLNDYSGAYVGVGGEVGAFARSFNARIYVQPSSCASVVNPLSCSNLMVSFSTEKDPAQQATLQGAVKGLYLELSESNGGR